MFGIEREVWDLGRAPPTDGREFSFPGSSLGTPVPEAPLPSLSVDARGFSHSQRSSASGKCVPKLAPGNERGWLQQSVENLTCIAFWLKANQEQRN